MPQILSAGLQIHWESVGRPDSPTLVLLNSIGTDTSLWEQLVPRLAQRFRVIRIDTRGHGRSEVATEDATLAELAEDVAAVLDAAGVVTASVAGVSLGGMMAMELALRHPERVAALVLVCTSATMDRASWTDRVTIVRREGMTGIAGLALARFFSAPFTEAHPEIVGRVRATLEAMPPAGYAAAGAAIRDMDLRERIAAIRAPTLVVAGDLDSSTPFPGHGEHLVRTIPGARCVCLPCGHLAPLEVPEPLAAAMLDFLRPEGNAVPARFELDPGTGTSGVAGGRGCSVMVDGADDDGNET